MATTDTKNAYVGGEIDRIVYEANKNGQRLERIFVQATDEGWAVWIADHSGSWVSVS